MIKNFSKLRPLAHITKHTYYIKFWSCVNIFPYVNPCPAEPGFILFENSVDPDQLGSEEAI